MHEPTQGALTTHLTTQLMQKYIHIFAHFFIVEYSLGSFIFLFWSFIQYNLHSHLPICQQLKSGKVKANPALTPAVTANNKATGSQSHATANQKADVFLLYSSAVKHFLELKFLSFIYRFRSRIQQKVQKLPLPSLRPRE